MVEVKQEWRQRGVYEVNAFDVKKCELVLAGDSVILSPASSNGNAFSPTDVSSLF